MALFKSFAVASAAVLLAATTYAAPQTAAPKAGSTKTASTKSAPKPKSKSVVGTLDKYDSGANTIVVNTGKGTETLTLSSTSSIHMGAKTMSASDLSGHIGDHVKVRAMDSNGQLTAQSVQVQGKPTTQAKAQTSSKQTPKK